MDEIIAQVSSLIPILSCSAVTKPVVGVFDLASNLSGSLRDAANPADLNEIARIRYPRFIGQDGILRVSLYIIYHWE